MNKTIKHIFSLVLVLSVLYFISSCDRMPVGYLQTDEAVFTPDTVYVYRNLDPQSDRVLNDTPWTSLRIQGVSGTAPINYEFHSVKANDGGNQEAFEKLAESKELVVEGGIIRLFQSGVKKVPNGSYTLSLKIYNEGYSATVEDVFTFVIKDSEF